jgi:hypothetical protein
MGWLRAPVLAALIGGSLAYGSYVLWYWAQDWASHTALADFPYLVGLGAVIAFLTVAELVIEVGKRLLGGHSAAE